MKRLLSYILTTLIIASLFPVAIFAARFDDVADGKWYTEGIKFCVENGYMAGVSDNLFDRSGTLTRAMFVTILAQVDGVDLDYYADRSAFSDVAIGKWYTGAITWAAENGLASGIGEGLFGYKNNVTREQMALFLYVYTGYKGLDVSASFEVSGFEDAGRIHDWALDAVEWAVAIGLISGTSDTTLDPRGTCTRAQTAVIIHAFVGGYLNTHEWYFPICWDQENYCTICGIKAEPVAHEYGEDNHCIYCGGYKPCEIHTWVPATCTNNGYCTVCYAENPEHPIPLGHDFNEETHVCSRCRLFKDDSLSNFENVKKNIQYNGTPLPDGSLAISNKYPYGNLFIFMRPNNDEDFFVQFCPEQTSDLVLEYSGTIELTFDDTYEIDFNMDISRNGEFEFSASGTIDTRRDKNFDGMNYIDCTELKDVYNESDLTDSELAIVINHLIYSTMSCTKNTAQIKFDLHNFIIDIYS